MLLRIAYCDDEPENGEKLKSTYYIFDKLSRIYAAKLWGSSVSIFIEADFI